MKKILIFCILFIIVVIIISRTCIFPLSAGSINSGLIAIESIRKQQFNRQMQAYPLVAVLVEPRKENLINILSHFIDKMPPYTHFQVYHGIDNEELIYKHFNPYIKSNKISLWNLGVENLTIQGYSALLTSKHFWNSIQSEKVLIFQTDAITCGQSNFDITQFDQYDFIGAPLPNHINILINILFYGKGYILNHKKFYNGGLSYRRKSKMLQVIEQHPWDKLCPEDIWFCAFLPKIGGILPSKDDARKFSFESEDLNYIPWGVHKPRNKYNVLCKICPEVKQIPHINGHTDYRNLYLI